MRLLFVPLCLLVAGSLHVCSREEKSSVGASASAAVSGVAVVSPPGDSASGDPAEVKGVLSRPRIGGSVAPYTARPPMTMPRTRIPMCSTLE